jgi:hypothetical protein
MAMGWFLGRPGSRGNNLIIHADASPFTMLIDKCATTLLGGFYISLEQGRKDLLTARLPGDYCLKSWETLFIVMDSIEQTPLLGTMIPEITRDSIATLVEKFIPPHIFVVFMNSLDYLVRSLKEINGKER